MVLIMNTIPDIEVVEIDVETDEQFFVAVFVLECDARFFIEKRLESLPEDTPVAFKMQNKFPY